MQIEASTGAKLKVQIDEEAAAELAIRARGTPRIANNLLSWVRDFAMVKAKGIITKQVAEDALTMQEVDRLGLEEPDRKYLQTLVKIFAGGPAGVQAIGHSINVPVDTLEDEIEPFLLRNGLIQRTPRGRIITTIGLEHIGMTLPDQNGGDKTPSTLF